jgi:hypothetical protein
VSFHVKCLFFLSLVCILIGETTILFLNVVILWYFVCGLDFSFVQVCRRLDDKLLSVQIRSRLILKVVSQSTEGVIFFLGN